jgi:hypothetical protein
MKLIQVFNSSERQVKVYWCKEWSEYQCKLYEVVSGKAKFYEPATYHTDDKQDALDTARKMIVEVCRLQ